ncbi:MAG: ribonucleoside triphosphate reductase [bacterium]
MARRKSISKFHIDKIRKRDGRIVEFEKEKITKVILAAMRAVSEGSEANARKVTESVLKDLEKKYDGTNRKNNFNIPTVENIQDIVERQLILHKFADTAKAYILYRDLHSRMRNINNMFDIGAMIQKYIDRKDWKVNADSSIDYSLQGMYKHMINEMTEQYWMNEVLTEEMSDLHENKDLYIHKMSALSSYCVGWDLYDLLKVGYQGVPGFVNSNPPKHFSSALGQLVNFMYTLTQETPDGAVAISSIDTYLAPFIYYDKLDYDQVLQQIQEFVFNMNIPTKLGAQMMFSNITLDLECPKYLSKEAALVGGKLTKKRYGDFQKEMDMFNKALLEVYVGGDANGRAFTWPIPTYNITKNFDWDNKNIKGLWEMTAKYGTPYFANFVNSDMDPEDARSMCCRLRIDNRELKRRGGGLFGANPLTGSIDYVTINLPRIGYQNKNDKKSFYKRLEYLLELSRKVLNKRREVVEQMTERGLYPYTRFYLRSVKEKTGKYWSNHFNTVGLIGMNEATLNFMGKDITTKEGQKFAKEVLDFMNKKILGFQKKDDILYNLEASPAEGASYAIAKKDKDLFPDIIVGNEKQYKLGAEPFYTNSTQLPVDFKGDVFEALDLQDDLQAKYTGGTVFHAFMGERMGDGEAAKSLVRKIVTNYKLPYLTITPTFSICESHGYIKGEHFECPKCGKECMVYSRVVGKITPVQRWNLGKKAEFAIREEFNPDDYQK